MINTQDEEGGCGGGRSQMCDLTHKVFFLCSGNVRNRICLVAMCTQSDNESFKYCALVGWFLRNARTCDQRIGGRGGGFGGVLGGEGEQQGEWRTIC